MERESCDRYAGDFLGSLDKVLDSLAESPRRVTSYDWIQDATFDVQVDAPVVLYALYSAMSRQDGANAARDAILEAAVGEDVLLIQMLESWAVGVLSQDIHEPVFISVRCDIDGDWTEQDFVRRASISRYYGAHFPQASFVNPCGYWTRSRAPQVMREPVISSIPTLIFSGEYDPVTPAMWGERVAATLENSHHFVMHRAGHVVLLDNLCAMEIMRAFLADPTAMPDSGCRDEIMPGVRRQR